jgi:early secretory antigenic target protein ESAT-6
MDETHVKFESLSTGATGIMATHRALQGTLEQLESQLNPMVNSWSGDARESYFQQKKKWEEASQAMAAILRQMGQSVDQAHGNYQSAETSNRNLWS